MKTSEILFTRQRHLADRAGDHYDIRLVIGNKAHSFATRKELPEEGKSIMLYETSIHTKDYALRKRIVIPPGNYGSGTTTLDFVRKATLTKNEDKGHFIMETTKGERYLLKPLDISGKKTWLFKNLGKKVNKNLGKKMNKYLEKVARYYDEDYRMREMEERFDRMDRAEEANDLLEDHGYYPHLSYRTRDEDKVDDLIRLHDKTYYEPRKASSAVKTALGSIGGGLGGGGLGAVLASAALGPKAVAGGAVIGGLAGGIGAGIITRKHTYGEQDRLADEKSKAEAKNIFLEHLANNYTKITSK